MNKNHLRAIDPEKAFPDSRDKKNGNSHPALLVSPFYCPCAECNGKLINKMYGKIDRQFALCNKEAHGKWSALDIRERQEILTELRQKRGLKDPC